jgi:hypothetical protein
MRRKPPHKYYWAFVNMLDAFCYERGLGSRAEKRLLEIALQDCIEIQQEDKEDALQRKRLHRRKPPAAFTSASP